MSAQKLRAALIRQKERLSIAQQQQPQQWTETAPRSPSAARQAPSATALHTVARARKTARPMQGDAASVTTGQTALQRRTRQEGSAVTGRKRRRTTAAAEHSEPPPAAPHHKRAKTVSPRLPSPAVPAASTAAVSSSSRSLLSSLSPALSASRFRWLNEALYTLPSSEAFSYFSQHRAEYDAYHAGFRQQVARWPLQPLSVIIAHLSSLPPHRRIADMGCGDAAIAAAFHPHTHSVQSFDLVSSSPLVTACNIRRTPLAAASVDVAVYCLSLMPTDYPLLLLEARRVLVQGGLLLVAEVASRMQAGGGVEEFVQSVEEMGFVRKRIVKNEYFVCIWLHKAERQQGKKERGDYRAVLTPCLYKKR